MSEQNKHVCFSCLKESENSKVCCHCGAEIDELDMSASQFMPPQKGVVSISCCENTELLLGIVDSAIERISSLYHDSFKLIGDGSDRLLIECNDIAGTRLVQDLSKEFKKREMGCNSFFSKN